MQCTAYDIHWLTSGENMTYEQRQRGAPRGSGPVQEIETPEGRGYYVPGEGPKYVDRTYEMRPALVLGDKPAPDTEKGKFPWWIVLAAGGAYAVTQL